MPPLQGRRSPQDLDRTTEALSRLPGHRNRPLNFAPPDPTRKAIPMTDNAHLPTHPAAVAAHPGRSPPSHRNSPRLTGAPSSTARRACVSCPKQTVTQSASPKTSNSPACWSRSLPPVAAPTPSTSPAPPPPWTAQPASSSATTTQAPNPANVFSSAAATAGQPSAPHAHASMRATPSTSSVRASSAARTSLPQSATGPGSSSP